MKVVCIGDTRGKQGELFTTGCRLKVPAGDVLLQAGDLTSQGRPAECAAALSWLGTLAERDSEAFAALVPPSVT